MPDAPAPPPYVPPKPEVFTAANGMTVWLVERHTVPYVAMTLSVPSGSSSDPTGAWGLAMMTADMLDEGAGSRGGVALSRALDAVGATLETTANTDESRVSLTVLEKNLAPAFALFADVVARPRFDAAEWRREHEAVENELVERASDLEEVAKVVARAALFGPNHPYGHPVEGTLDAARRWTLADVQAFYRQAWRPDRAVLVVVGDVTRAKLAGLVDAKDGLGTWRSPATPPPVPLTPAAPTGPWPRVVLVDRPDTESAVAITRLGVAAADPTEPVLARVNLALGGGPTSRLAQDLRDEQGASGAGSRLGLTRGEGAVVASTLVVTEKAVDALKVMLGDLDGLARGGLNEAEVERTRSLTRADLVETFEGAERAAGHLALDASLGLGPDYEQAAAARRDSATKADLDTAARLFDPSHAVIVVVGPRASLEGPLRAMGLSEIQYRDVDGNVRNVSTAAPAVRKGR